MQRSRDFGALSAECKKAQLLRETGQGFLKKSRPESPSVGPASAHGVMGVAPCQQSVLWSFGWGPEKLPGLPPPPPPRGDFRRRFGCFLFLGACPARACRSGGDWGSGVEEGTSWPPFLCSSVSHSPGNSPVSPFFALERMFPGNPGGPHARRAPGSPGLKLCGNITRLRTRASPPSIPVTGSSSEDTPHAHFLSSVGSQRGPGPGGPAQPPTATPRQGGRAGIPAGLYFSLRPKA